MKKLLISLLLSISLLGSLPAFATPTDLTPKVPPSTNGSISANAADLTFTACDTSGGNSCAHTGREMILCKNTNGASTSYVVTVSSVADELGRTGDQTYTVGAGKTAVLGPYPVRGWRQSTGKLLFSSTNTELQFCVITIPNSI